MLTIVSEKAFYSLFSRAAQVNAERYSVAVELFKKTKNRSEIARALNHPNRTVCEWVNGEKRPHIICASDKLKEIKLLPLKINVKSPHFVLFLEIFAFIYGDGSLKKDFSGIDLCGQHKDLKRLQHKIKNLFKLNCKLIKIKSSSFIKRSKNGLLSTHLVEGTAFYLRINSTALAKILFLAGAPKGDKVKSDVRIPFWIMNGSKETKRIFLSVLFGNELQCPVLRAKNAFSSPTFGVHKIESLEKDVKNYLCQIKKLLKNMGISSSKINSETCKTIRGDGSISKKYYFSIDSHAPNILRLHNEIPFEYAIKKQNRFDKSVKTFLKSFSKLEQDWKIYEKVLKLHSNGLGRRKIFKILNLPPKYFYKINAWLHYNQKPLYYNEKDVIEGSHSIL